MSTIQEVSLRNFRGFAELEALKLAQLTFLVGPNNSGKSSIADALLFMAQSGFLSLEATSPLWTGPLVDLGSFKDTVFRHDMKRTAEIRAKLGTNTRGVKRSLPSLPSRPPGLSLEVTAEIKTAKEAPEGRLRRLAVCALDTDEKAEVVRRAGRHETFEARLGSKSRRFDPQNEPWLTPNQLFARLMVGVYLDAADEQPPAMLMSVEGLKPIAATIQRVSSGRHPPQRTYPREGGGVGDRARRLLNDIDPAAIEAGRAGRRRIRDWLVDGLVSLEIADDLHAEILSDYHTAIRLQDNVTRVTSNLADFGYGASQVIPVLEGCALPGPGPLFIEQPEIHLHPRAQGHVAQILCDASRRRQIIVETHSEHMINRARLLVAEGKLKASDVVIQYIDRKKQGSFAMEIGLDDAGNFTCDFPNGFYDERYHDTMKIVEAQARRGGGR